MNKIIDKVTAEKIMNEAGEINDGFFIFASQGQNAVEMVKYSSNDVDLFEITVYEVINNEEYGCGLDLSELSQFPTNLDNLYKIIRVIYHDDKALAHHCLSTLILELNHF